jgi:hypothetical protein
MKSLPILKTCLFFVAIMCAISAQARPNIIDYYKKINLAELAICEHNFTLANRYYKEAFSINERNPFNVDLKNAFHSAMDVQEYALAEKYMAILLKRGIDDEDVDSLTKTYAGEDAVKINAMMRKHPKKQQTDLDRRIKEMFTRDRGVRYYFMELYDGDYMVDSTYIVDSILSAELMVLMKQHKFPDEDKVDTKYYDIIMLHNTGQLYSGRPGHIFDTLLYKAVLDFKFDARYFLHLVQLSPAAPAFSYAGTTINLPAYVDVCLYRGSYYPEYWEEESEKKMTESRAKLGLESIDDFRKKLIATRGVKKTPQLYKYSFVRGFTAVEIESEARFNKWQEQNGEHAPVKRSLTKRKLHIPKFDSLKVGSIHGDYTIGKTKYSERKTYFDNMHPDYIVRQPVYYKEWKDRVPPLPWLYHAEVFADPKEKLTSDTARKNHSKFVPGYSMLIEYGHTLWHGRFMHMEEIFDFQKDSVLISFTANVDTGYYKTFTKYQGIPTETFQKVDTVESNTIAGSKVLLRTKRFVWKKGKNKAEITLTDYQTKNGTRKTKATFQMVHIPLYEAYLAKVAEEKKRLDKLYAKNGK